MACFLVPAAEAIVTTIIKKAVKTKEIHTENEGVRFSEKLGWLNKMLWGGSALLAFEHIWNGEVTLWFPFLTNAADAASRSEMLFEIGTSGVAMAVLVTAVWGVMTAVSGAVEKKKSACAEET